MIKKMKMVMNTKQRAEILKEYFDILLYTDEPMELI
jgi:hypothetical protein